MKCTLKLFINMALLTANEMYLKHLLFIAERRCNGVNDTSLCTKCDSLIDPEFYLILITTTGTTSYFMWRELLSSSETAFWRYSSNRYNDRLACLFSGRRYFKSLV
jgi:hypothetical protein